MNITDEKLSVAIKAVAVRLGYAKLKPCQEIAVKSFVLGNDLFLSLPTGYGKSLAFCYASLPLVFNILKEKQSPCSFVIVISHFGTHERSSEASYILAKRG